MNKKIVNAMIKQANNAKKVVIKRYEVLETAEAAYELAYASYIEACIHYRSTCEIVNEAIEEED